MTKIIMCPNIGGQTCALYLAHDREGTLVLGRMLADKVPMADAPKIAESVRSLYEGVDR